MPIKKDKKGKKKPKSTVINTKGSMTKTQEKKGVSQSLTVNVNLGKKGNKRVSVPKSQPVQPVYQVYQPLPQLPPQQPIKPVQQVPDYFSILEKLINTKITTPKEIPEESIPVKPKKTSFKNKNYYNDSEFTKAEELQYNYDFGSDFGVPSYAKIYPEVPVANAEYVSQPDTGFSEVETVITSSTARRRGRPKVEKSFEDITREREKKNQAARERYWKKKEQERLAMETNNKSKNQDTFVFDV